MDRQGTNDGCLRHDISSANTVLALQTQSNRAKNTPHLQDKCKPSFFLQAVYRSTASEEGGKMFASPHPLYKFWAYFLFSFDKFCYKFTYPPPLHIAGGDQLGKVLLAFNT